MTTPNPDQLFKNADLALYQAKQEGRSNYRLYDPVMNEEVHARKALEQDIRQALEQGDFFLNYQPHTNIASGRITRVAAPSRRRDPGARPGPRATGGGGNVVRVRLRCAGYPIRCKAGDGSAG